MEDKTKAMFQGSENVRASKGESDGRADRWGKERAQQSRGKPNPGSVGAIVRRFYRSIQVQ